MRNKDKQNLESSRVLDIDDCNPSPCKQGGACTDLVNRYNCTCPPGYTGQDCSTDIDECAASPCKYGGSCSDTANGFTCTCLPGFTGHDCSTAISKCVSSPCQHNSTCYDVSNDYYCHCLRGFTGKTCGTDIDDCAGNPCENGGTCEDKIGDFDCKCPPGFWGKICQLGYDFCASGPCKNGGRCVNTFKGPTCHCMGCYHGNKCEKHRPCNTGTSTDSFGASTRSTTGDPAIGRTSPQPGGAGKVNPSVKSMTLGTSSLHPHTMATVTGSGSSLHPHTVATITGSGRGSSDASPRVALTTVHPRYTLPGVTTSECSARKYSDCQCFISPDRHRTHQEFNQTARRTIVAVLGLIIGLGLSVITFRCCLSPCITKRSNASIKTKRLPPTFVKGRTRKWVNGIVTPAPNDPKPLRWRNKKASRWDTADDRMFPLFTASGSSGEYSKGNNRVSPSPNSPTGWSTPDLGTSPASGPGGDFFNEGTSGKWDTSGDRRYDLTTASTSLERHFHDNKVHNSAPNSTAMPRVTGSCHSRDFSPNSTAMPRVTGSCHSRDF